MPIINKVHDEIPIQIPRETEIYPEDKLVVFKPGFTIAGQSTFSCFHFVIPESILPPMEVDRKKISCQGNRIYSINPGEVVTCEKERKVIPYTAIFMDKQLIKDASIQISSKSDVIFANKGPIPNRNLISMLNQFIYECKTKQIGYEFTLQCLSLLIAVELLRALDNTISGAAPMRERTDKPNIERCVEYLRKNYNNRFSIGDVAQIANLSPYHFIRVFKLFTGKTPYEYLLDIKIEKSKEMLKARKNTITEISLNCGFSSTSHFCTPFKKKVGVSPSDFQRMFQA